MTVHMCNSHSLTFLSMHPFMLPLSFSPSFSVLSISLSLPHFPLLHLSLPPSLPSECTYLHPFTPSLSLFFSPSPVLPSPPPSSLPPSPPTNQTSPPDLEWFPRLRCMSLNIEEAENTEQNEMRELRDQLEETKFVVKQLSSQLSDLRDKVRCSVSSIFLFCELCRSRVRFSHISQISWGPKGSKPLKLKNVLISEVS